MNHEKLLPKNKAQVGKQRKPYNGKTDNMKGKKTRKNEQICQNYKIT